MRRYPLGTHLESNSLSADLALHGFGILPVALSPHCIDQIASQLERSEFLGPGTRGTLDFDWCWKLASTLRALPALSPLLADRVAVHCSYFDKHSSANWLVPIHQDLSIPVNRVVDTVSLVGWSNKQGRLFVQAPVNVLEQMVAARLHLDDNDHENGPLRVVAGSHRFGRIAARDCARHRLSRGEVECHVPRGGVLLMKPLLLHASSKAKTTSRRRVLHFVFGPRDLPFGLEWAQAA